MRLLSFIFILFLSTSVFADQDKKGTEPAMQPTTTQPATQPTTTQPATQPTTTQPATQPTTTQPATQPTTTQPATQPTTTQPATQPTTTQPATQPTTTQPATQPTTTQPATQPAISQEGNAQTVCLSVTRRVPSAAFPFSAPRVVTEDSSGVRFGTRVITDLENVRGAVSISVRVPGNAPLSARVLFSGWDTGLALLGPENPGLADMPDLSMDRSLPAIDNELTLSSCGGGSLELHRLRVDRVFDGALENNDGLQFRLLGVSAPVALRHTQTGAPVFLEKRLAGILHTGKTNYVIPARTISRFLADISDGAYNGIPRRPFEYQTLQQTDLRRYLNLPATFTGVRITRAFGDSLLLPGDYLSALDGNLVGNDGLITMGPATQTMDQFFMMRQPGKINATVTRAGKDITLAIEGNPLADGTLHARRAGDRRVFFYGAGLIFQELDYEIMHDTDAARDSQLRYRYWMRQQDRLYEETDRDVILTNIFPDTVNLGAEKYRYAPLESLNGSVIRNLKDLKAVWLSASTQFLVLRFRNRPGYLVIPREDLKRDEKRIRDKYNLIESGITEGMP